MTDLKRSGMDLELPEPSNYLSIGETIRTADEQITRELNAYKCSCKQWHQQKGIPYNSRTCDHLINYLGNLYENARLSWAAALLAQVDFI
jgi:hypothetical protein